MLSAEQPDAFPYIRQGRRPAALETCNAVAYYGQGAAQLCSKGRKVTHVTRDLSSSLSIRMSRNRTIRIKGRDVGVLEVFTLNGKQYFAVERLSGARERYKVFDPRAGLGGDFRVLQLLPQSRQATEYLNVLARLSQNNNNCPTILDFEARGRDVLLLLQWVTGPTLADYMKRSQSKRGPGLSVYEAIRLFRGFAHGLTQLSHRKNVVHGDLHPGNLIVCREPNRLVLVDFGSAWLVERTAKRNPADGVHPGYAAPELLSGKTRFADFRSDQFSATVIFYEMLARKLPYDGIGGQAGLEGHEAYVETYVPPSKACPDRKLLTQAVWDQLDAVVQRGLSIAPEDRYRNRRDWLRALDDIRYAVEKADRLDEEDAFLIRAIRWLHRLFPDAKR